MATPKEPISRRAWNLRALIGVWSVFQSRRLMVIALAIVACIPLVLFVYLMYRLAAVAS